ncbi:MAG TPA: 16S rRNA (cytidine(1402)-2'-O)-methyltransferase [Desulforhopalus sp.]|nr:16S rRNA (cytidine(1402)-2'-O)-methyltransferase [Desulforhopalus sp.]
MMTATAHPSPGTLYIVPTPIGNLEDITLRALRVLREVDLIAAEDTRHSRKLLNHYGIVTPLCSYYRENEEQRSSKLLRQLEEGKSIALISDAGTPGISDPGAIVVRHAHQAGLPVVPLPGASALTTAVSAAGLTTGGFLFQGFLPSKSGQRKKTLATLIDCAYPIVFYESPQRITGLLSDALEVFGDREAFWGRELTKSFEELQFGCLSALLVRSAEVRNRGEFVLIISPGEREPLPTGTLEELLLWYRDNSTLSVKDVSLRLAADLGIHRSKIYQQALILWQDKP